MNQKIYPHQYHALHQQINDLINAYQSVNDLQTIQVYQALIFEKIDELFFDRPTEIEQLKSELLDKSLTKARAQRILEPIKELVIPFEKPSAKQVEKAFRKVKKLKAPDFDALDLRDYSYIGFDDAGSQKKYLLYYAVKISYKGLSDRCHPIQSKMFVVFVIILGMSPCFYPPLKPRLKEPILKKVTTFVPTVINAIANYMN